MQMMYGVIYKALVEAGLDKTYEPQDYLNFFCLGNREAQDREGVPQAKISNGTTTPQVSLTYYFVQSLHDKIVLLYYQPSILEV